MGEAGSPPPLDYASTNQLEPDPQARTLGMLCHLLALCGYVFPLGNIIGPLVLWLVKKDQYPFVDDQGKESLNFQLTVLIAVVVCILLMFVCVGVFLLVGVSLAALVFEIIAAVKANEGRRYRYPIVIRFFR
jgi:uncharacterized Tic20 family protein